MEKDGFVNAWTGFAEVLFLLVILFLLISVTGVIGNEVGYWFGFYTGPALFHRADNFWFKKKHLRQAKRFYDRHGGAAVVLARFLPVVRTFAPVVAGIVKMDKRRFLYCNILGSGAWVFVVLLTGHYLEKLCLDRFGFDLRQHLLLIIFFIVVITTVPVLYKLFRGDKIFGRR